MASKIVKSRDSATALLRKLGVAPTDYTMYIEKHKDGFEVFIDEASEAMGKAPSAEVAAPKAKTEAKPTKTKAKAKAKADPAPDAPAKQDLYAERYMAHDYLVHIGVAEEDTRTYIKKTKQGYVLIATEPKAPKAVKVKAEPKVREPKAAKPSKVDESIEDKIKRMTEGNSMSSFMRKCIVEGLGNREVLAEASKKFRWTSDQEKAKAWFPAWYRMDCRRQGLIANELTNGNVGTAQLRSNKKQG